MHSKKAQSTVEYVLLVSAVIAVVIYFTTQNNMGLRGGLNSVFNTATNDMITVSGQL